jgi:hypothetical protein
MLPDRVLSKSLMYFRTYTRIAASNESSYGTRLQRASHVSKLTQEQRPPIPSSMSSICGPHSQPTTLYEYSISRSYLSVDVETPPTTNWKFLPPVTIEPFKPIPSQIIHSNAVPTTPNHDENKNTFFRTNTRVRTYRQPFRSFSLYQIPCADIPSLSRKMTRRHHKHQS